MGFWNLLGRPAGGAVPRLEWKEPWFVDFRLHRDLAPRLVAGALIAVGTTSMVMLTGVLAGAPAIAVIAWGLLIGGLLSLLFVSATFLYGDRMDGRVMIYDWGIRHSWSERRLKWMRVAQHDWGYAGIDSCQIVPFPRARMPFSLLVIRSNGESHVITVPLKVDLRELARLLDERQVRLSLEYSIPSEALPRRSWLSGVNIERFVIAGFPILGLAAVAAPLLFGLPRRNARRPAAPPVPATRPRMDRLEQQIARPPFPRPLEEQPSPAIPGPPEGWRDLLDSRFAGIGPDPEGGIVISPLRPAATQESPAVRKAAPSTRRQWSDSAGRFHMEGSLESLADGRVTLRKPDGTRVVLPLDRLSADDRAYVNEQLPDGGEVPPPGAQPGDTQIGGNPEGGWQQRFEDIRPLLGIDYRLGSWGGQKTLAPIRPIYERSAASLSSVVAREGYAVGGMYVDGEQYVNALQIIFMRLGADGRLNPADSYTSEWIGFPTGRPARKIGGSGALVTGIHSREGTVLDGVGLITAASD